jgi:hypothetical protein
MDLHPDFKDLLSAFADTHSEYLIVGGWASAIMVSRVSPRTSAFSSDRRRRTSRRLPTRLERFGAPIAIVDAPSRPCA